MYDNGYYFFCLPLILYAFIVNRLICELGRPHPHPSIVVSRNDLNGRVKFSRWSQRILLLFSGFNGHITLVFLAILHTI